MWLVVKIIFATLRGYNMVSCSNMYWKEKSKFVEWVFINTNFYTRDIYSVGNQLLWYKKV